jgi:hypothetical protein
MPEKQNQTNRIFKMRYTSPQSFGPGDPEVSGEVLFSFISSLRSIQHASRIKALADDDDIDDDDFDDDDFDDDLKEEEEVSEAAEDDDEDFDLDEDFTDPAFEDDEEEEEFFEDDGTF